MAKFMKMNNTKTFSHWRSTSAAPILLQPATTTMSNQRKCAYGTGDLISDVGGSPTGPGQNGNGCLQYKSDPCYMA
jgi:hypothetical protein